MRFAFSIRPTARARKTPGCGCGLRPAFRNGAPPSGTWGDIAALEPVRDYKARHASTMLTFDAVVSAIDQIESKRRAEATPATAAQ